MSIKAFTTESDAFMPLCDLSRETFVQYLGGLYEQFEWVIERAYNTGLTAGHDNPELLARVFRQSLYDASESEKLALIQAYPDLLGKAAIAGRLSRSAMSEFASAGLDRCTPAQIECFVQLNSVYWARFGFPFVMAVQHSSIDSILKALDERARNDRETEIQIALIQVHRIARLRLDRLFSPDHQERGKETPLAQPVDMDSNVVSNTEQYPTDKSVSTSPDDDVAAMWNAKDKLPSKPGFLSRFAESQPILVKRTFTRVSEFFTPTALLACALSFSCGWIVSRLFR